METSNPTDITKRIKFLSVVLGVAGGVALVMVGLAVYLRSPFLIAPAIALGLTMIPLLASLRRLRRTSGAGLGEQLPPFKG